MHDAEWDDFDTWMTGKPRPCAFCETTLPKVPEKYRQKVADWAANKDVPPSRLAKNLRDRNVPTSYESIVYHRAHLDAA